jgi:hypothetical protein
MGMASAICPHDPAARLLRALVDAPWARRSILTGATRLRRGGDYTAISLGSTMADFRRQGRHEAPRASRSTS